MSHKIELETVTEKYKNELELVRQDTDLLNNYRFDQDATNSNQVERLRLNIAIYNDLKQTDFEIVKFLFTEESKWRKYGKDGEVDNLYFSAFLLTLFNNPEILWLFFDTKNIDFDSSIGFDGEFLLSSGIEKTYRYLNTVENPLRPALLRYIGETFESCNYSQEDIENWKEFKKEYFRDFKYPVQDELWFLYSTDERELFLSILPEWIKQQQEWSYNKLGLYRTYSRYSGNKLLEIEAVKLSIDKNDKEFLTDIYKRELSELYIEIGEYEKSFELLNLVIKGTDNTNIIRDCLEQLCRIILAIKVNSNKTVINSFEIVKREQKKYKHFSPNVDNLIIKVTEIMKEQSVTAHDSALPIAGRKWWQKLFGS